MRPSRLPTNEPTHAVSVVAITPFAEDGTFDEEMIRAHLRRMGDAGVGVYVGGGGSGEGYALSEDETQRLVELAVAELKGRVPVRAMGKEPRLATEMIEYAAMAGRAGVDSCQIYSLDQGHGHRPTMAELERYFDDILSATDVPAVLSTHQSVGYRIPVDMLERLIARYPQVIGVNCSHADIGYLRRIIDTLGSEVFIHVGGPMLALTNLALGGHGYVCSEANLAPFTCRTVIDRFEAGDASGMLAAFDQVLRLFDGLYGQGGIRATKSVLRRLGLTGGWPRPPQLPIDEQATEGLMRLVERLGIAEREGFVKP